MRRTGVVWLALTLLTGSLGAPAGAARKTPGKVTREAVATYGFPWLSSPSTGEGCFGDGCVRFRISGSERWATIEVRDGSGTPTAFEISQRTDAAETVRGPFCGSTGKKPVRLEPRVEVVVYVYALGDVACPGSIGTTGTVRAEFSNLP